MKALSVFKDLVAFLTIIPSTKEESFIKTSARYMFVLKAFICAEVSAKLAMFTMAWFGKPAYGGLGELFVKLNKGNKLIALSYLISFFIILPLAGFSSIAFLLISFFAGFILEKLSERVFGGTSGDVLGATNELVRAICLLAVAGGVIA
jgi:adenosylcobinamide-GDP ribazoletransferase